MTDEQPKKKCRRVHYRKCEIINNQGELFTLKTEQTLEQLLDNAFEELDGNEDINRLYRGHSDIIEEFSAQDRKLAKYGECKCGTIFLTKKAAHVPARGTSDSGVFITHAKTVTEKGEVPPIKQIVIFAISGNHLAYIAESNNGDTRLTDFFSWFLKTKTSILPISSSIHLNNKIRINIQKSIKQHGVKKVMLDYPPLHASGDIGNNVKNSLTLPSSPVVHTETIYNSLDDCRIQVTISSGSKKNHNLESIQQLATRATETDLDNLVVILNNGLKISKDELLPSGQIQINFKRDVISQINAMQEVSKWLTAQLNNHTIH